MSGVLAFGVRKTAIGVVLLLALASLTFWINYAIPQDAGMFILGNVQNPTREQIQQANHRLGVDRPALMQYGDFVGALARGDLGVSWTTAELQFREGVVGEPVCPTRPAGGGVTGSLVLGGASSCSWPSALPLGPCLASRAGSALDRTILLITLAFVSTHPLVAALILQLVFGRKLEWLPDQGYCPFFGDSGRPDRGPDGPCSGPLDWATHLLLPWLSFSLLFLALYLRQIRTQSLDLLNEPFVTVARAKGATEQQVLTRHVVPTVLTVFVAMVAMDVGTALGVALSRRGGLRSAGPRPAPDHALQGFSGYDRPVIVGIVIVTGTIVICEPRRRSDRRCDRSAGSRRRNQGCTTRGRRHVEARGGRSARPARHRAGCRALRYSPAAGGHQDENPGRPGTRPSREVPKALLSLGARSAIGDAVGGPRPPDGRARGASLPGGPRARRCGARRRSARPRSSRSSVTSWTRPIRRAVGCAEPLARDEVAPRSALPDLPECERRDDGRDDPELHLGEREDGPS